MNLLEFRKLIPDDDTALAFVRGVRWPNGITCPFCGCEDVGRRDARNKMRCKNLKCRRRFCERTGTLFRDSHSSIQKWLTGMFLFVSHRRALTSVDLAHYLRISQTAGYRQLKYFRQACQIDPRDLPDTIDLKKIDLDGKKKNRHLSRWHHRYGVRHISQTVMGVFDQDDRLVHFGVSGKESGESVLEVLITTLEPGVVGDERTAHVLGEINTRNISDLARLWKRVFLSVQLGWGHQFGQNHLDEVAFRMHMGLMGKSHLEAMHAMILNSVRVHKTRVDARAEFEELLDEVLSHPYLC